MKRAPSENELHASVAEFLDWALLPPAVWTTFPAGWGKLGKATAGRLKKCGLKEGMHDILIFDAGRCIGIAFNVGKNKQSAVQRNMKEKLLLAGVPVYVATCIETVADILRRDRLPTRRLSIGGSYGTQRQAPPQADGVGTSIT